MITRILFISSLFPNPLYPQLAPYNWQQILALREHCEVEVISPIPWTALLGGRFAGFHREARRISIYHPIYYYTPCYLRAYYGLFYYYSIRRVATEFLAQRKFDLIYASWLYPDAWAAAKIAEEFSLPLFIKVHGTDVNKLGNHGSLTRKSIQATTKAKKVICVSKALKARLLELGCATEKVEVLYNGVDRNIFKPLPREEMRQGFGIDRSQKLVVYVGNLKKEKGLKELMFAFDRLAAKEAGCRLAIIGTGPFEPEVRRIIAELSLAQHVSLMGGLDLPQIARWMNAASVVCLPSYSEGVPNVVLEALSCGAKVVATAVGGIPELDQCKRMMALVPPRDIAALSDALGAAINDPAPSVSCPFVGSWEQNARELFRIMTSCP